ncbi:hypothetical protein Fot_28238 [Forsythia ovata]|uniref:Uncharacterized protein n=1 Tax=Forsythia ovata TaxID=205694 RepID=A0ABD1TNG4_9LAMI
MAGIYFSKIPVFKIRSRGVVGEKEAILSQLTIPCTAPDPVATVPMAPEVAVDISSTLHLEESLPPSKNVRRPDKGKRIANDEGENTMPKRAMEDGNNAEDSRRAKRSRETPPWKIGVYHFFSSRCDVDLHSFSLWLDRTRQYWVWSG